MLRTSLNKEFCFLYLQSAKDVRWASTQAQRQSDRAAANRNRLLTVQDPNLCPSEPFC